MANFENKPSILHMTEIWERSAAHFKILRIKFGQNFIEAAFKLLLATNNTLNGKHTLYTLTSFLKTSNERSQTQYIYFLIYKKSFFFSCKFYYVSI